MFSINKECHGGREIDCTRAPAVLKDYAALSKQHYFQVQTALFIPFFPGALAKFPGMLMGVTCTQRTRI